MLNSLYLVCKKILHLSYNIAFMRINRSDFSIRRNVAPVVIKMYISISQSVFSISWP